MYRPFEAAPDDSFQQRVLELDVKCTRDGETQLVTDLDLMPVDGHGAVPVTRRLRERCARAGRRCRGGAEQCVRAGRLAAGRR